MDDSELIKEVLVYVYSYIKEHNLMKPSKAKMSGSNDKIERA
jgi:hypothetical protein